MVDVSIAGRSRETAEALLHAASKAGVDPTLVRTTMSGYTVPVEVSNYYQKMVRGETEPIEYHEGAGLEPEASDGSVAPEPGPDESWKNDEIKTWADAHGVDLGGAAKKADMLAAIQAANTEEG